MCVCVCVCVCWQLCFHLPARAEGCPWRLLYSSEKHGFSLNTLYRCMNRVDAPILLVIEDDSNQVTRIGSSVSATRLAATGTDMPFDIT